MEWTSSCWEKKKKAKKDEKEKKDFRDLNLSFEYDEGGLSLKPNISEADSWFRALISDDEDEEDRVHFDSFTVYNRDYLEQLGDIPDGLKSYFYEADEFETNTESDLLEAKEDFERA